MIKKKIKVWIDRWDEKDKRLSKKTRWIKWGGILLLWLVLYLTSYWMDFKGIELRRTEIPQVQAEEDTTLYQMDQSLFELPVDSFKQYLKQAIDEQQNIQEP